MVRDRQRWLRPDALQRVTPTIEPRTKPAEQRRGELLDAAAALVATGGADNLTIDAVTTRAGVGKGTFYLYFATKDDALQALRERLGAEMLDEHERSLAELDPSDHAGRLDRWVLDAIAGRVQRCELRDALFLRQRPDGETDTSVVADGAHVAILADLLQAGVEAGIFKIQDVDATAVLLYGGMHSGVDALLDAHGRDATSRLVAATRQLARRAAGVRD
jgi:AcrR family transcriptional regulator